MDAPDPDGWTRHDGACNPWRVKQDDPTVIQVLLPSKQIAMIDATRHADIAPHSWTADALDESQPYVISKIRRNGAWTTTSMHVYLFPAIPEPRDHRNRNPLDNRAANIHNGANGKNARNLDLPSGGVFMNSAKRSYMARWTEFNGKQRIAHFYWKNHPNRYAAKQAALRYRKREADKAVAIIDAAQAASATGIAVIQRHVLKKKISNTLIKGLSVECRDFTWARVRAAVTINGTQYRATFMISYYDSEDAAIDAAKAWLDEIKQQHPKLPRKKLTSKKRRKTKGSD